MDLLFKRGFIISEKSQDKYLDSLKTWIAKKWIREKIGTFNYYYDPDIEKYAYKNKNNFITLLGTIIDPINNIGDSKKIIKTLLEKLLADINDFYNYLDFLTGRFILIVETKNHKIILHDATGINAVFYNDLNDEIIISSHSQIIAEIKNYKIKDERFKIVNSKSFKSKTCYMPGLYTPYKEVSILSPNTLIDINEKRIKRFFPRTKLKKQTINDDLIKNIADVLKNTFDILIKKYKLAVSLTGGIDTRLTLASSKSHKDKIIYFTYVFDNDAGHYDDLKIAREISKAIKIKHEEYIINSSEHEEYLDLFNRNCSYLRSEKQGKLAYAIYKKYPKNYLHIKSTVSEIGEGFYFRHFPPIPIIKNLLPQILTYFYRTNKKSNFTKKAFMDFIKITNFNEILKYNYNYYDMFYWEHRNGCWQSLQNQDFNISHDIFIIYNNRYILNSLLSVPIKDRIECTLQFKIINYLWPELSNIKFNSWKPNTLRQKITKKIWDFFSFFLP